eukprot:1623052-Rhodomonas_salina.1
MKKKSFDKEDAAHLAQHDELAVLTLHKDCVVAHTLVVGEVHCRAVLLPVQHLDAVAEGHDVLAVALPVEVRDEALHAGVVAQPCACLNVLVGQETQAVLAVNSLLLPCLVLLQHSASAAGGRAGLQQLHTQVVRNVLCRGGVG